MGNSYSCFQSINQFVKDLLFAQITLHTSVNIKVDNHVFCSTFMGKSENQSVQNQKIFTHVSYTVSTTANDKLIDFIGNIFRIRRNNLEILKMEYLV